MTAAHLPMVNGWLRTPEVARWWPSEPLDADDLDEAAIRLWIVSLDGAPFAYLQDYDPHAWPEHPFDHLPPGSRGIDQFIGVPSLIGQGHGSAFIRAHLSRLFAEGAPTVGTDPHPDNARAIRAYAKVGFTRLREQQTEWGLALLMTAAP